MKNLILLLFFAHPFLRCTSQAKFKAWLPEKYVNALKMNEKNSDRYLLPIEGFESVNNSLNILLYRGELRSLKTKKVKMQRVQKLQLFDLKYHVNLKYNSRNLVEKLANATIYLTKLENKILVEIIENGNTEMIYFVDRSGEYKFKNISDAKKHLQSTDR